MIVEIIEDFISKNSKIKIDNLNELKIFDKPIVGFSSPNDNIFNKFCEEELILYKKFKHPYEWMDDAETIISIFFPYSKIVKESNGKDFKYPSDEWLYARYEGQEIINRCLKYLKKQIEEIGYKAIIPSLSKEINSSSSGKDNRSFYSNWSERHVAFVSGLGTFSLSGNFITKKGTAGRFGSLITDYKHVPSNRSYKSVYEYCLKCGKCIENCPVNAITQYGKNHYPCSKFLDYTGVKSAPRYGCGKCQINTPCMNKIPV